MLSHKEKILDLFKKDNINYTCSDKNFTIFVNFLIDFKLQQLDMYCFNNNLYFDVSAKKNNVVISIYKDEN